MIIFRSAAEARSQLHQEIPNLVAATYSINGPFGTEYQCIAWAACRTDRVWWPWDHPRFYWPPGFAKFPVGSPVPAAHFALMFEKKFGYRTCGNPAFEFGYQKVAIFENALGVTHMARQHFLGRGWLSKLGSEEDIVHQKLTDVEGNPAAAAQQYGKVVQYMKRSWWTALVTTCLFRSFWAALKFRFYKAFMRWDLK
jgi:hypothetical protein